MIPSSWRLLHAGLRSGLKIKFKMKTTLQYFKICLRNVLTVQDAECFLQRLNLLLAAGYPVLITHTRIDTGWLELFIVCKCSIKLFLSAIKVSFLLLQGLLLVLLLGALVLDVL